MKNTNRLIKIFLCLVLFSESLSAYELSKSGRWPVDSMKMYVDVNGANGLWNQTLEKAMIEWNQATEFSFFIERQFSDPCNEQDKRNGVAFTKTICGDEYGDALAVTLSISITSTGIKEEVDMAFNRNLRWNVYDGAIKDAERGGRLFDFHRVALHELGHAIGLGHTPQSSNSIMAPKISGSLFSLKADDVHGIKAIKNINFMNNCINKFSQYAGQRNGIGYQCGDFTCQNTTGGAALKVLTLALPHDAQPNSTLLYFTNDWHTISLADLGFCN